MTRITPFDLAFADLADRFEEVRTEAERQQRDTADRGQFASIPAVQRIVDDVAAAELVEEAPEAADEYLTLLYAAYRYWATGRPTVSLTRETLEKLLTAGTSHRPVAVPEDACYLQLPERVVWAQIGPDQPHEPMDGLFVVAGPAGRERTVVAVLGLRPERGGFSQITVIATPEDLAAAPDEARRPPFAPVLAGGERMGLKSVTSPAELLLLAALATGRTAK